MLNNAIRHKKISLEKKGLVGLLCNISLVLWHKIPGAPRGGVTVSPCERVAHIEDTWKEFTFLLTTVR